MAVKTPSAQLSPVLMTTVPKVESFAEALSSKGKPAVIR